MMFSKIKIVTVLSLGLLVVGSTNWNDENPHFKVKLKLSDYKSQMLELQQMQIDIAGVNLKKQEVGVIVTDSEIEKLRSHGFKVNKKQFLGVLKVDEQYKTPAEIEQILRQYNSKYPNLTEMVSIGKSIEGRDIWALKISNKESKSRLRKPTFYINGMHHAREVMSPEVPLDMIDYLLTRYGQDKMATNWVDQNEIWAVPMLNVDGNNVVWQKNNWWRKNTHGGYGVDINRNYPYMWGQCNGSSGSKNSDAYRGESAGSEPETQAVVNLVKQIRPVTSLSLHSFGELVLYPYSCEGQHTPHQDFFQKLGIVIKQQIPGDEGGAYTAGTPWEILYSVDGGDIDWMYNEFNVLPLVIEMNTEFQPSYQLRDKTVSKLRVVWMKLLDVLSGPGVRGKIEGGGSHIIHVENISGKAQWQTYDYKTDADGNFHIVLEPGKYRLHTDNKVLHEIEVGNERLDL